MRPDSVERHPEAIDSTWYSTDGFVTPFTTR